MGGDSSDARILRQDLSFLRRLGRSAISIGDRGFDHLSGLDLLLHLSDQDDGGEGTAGSFRHRQGLSRSALVSDGNAASEGGFDWMRCCNSSWRNSFQSPVPVGQYCGQHQKIERKNKNGNKIK